MTNKEIEKNYHINVSHSRVITKGDDLVIDIYIKLTDKELELMEKQQLQVNEQIMLQEGGTKTISYTHLIEHMIKPIDKELKEKIIINNTNESDAIILKKWMIQLLNITEKHILKAKNVDDLFDKNKKG